MRVFACQNCGQLLHFENTSCLNCGFALGFLPDRLVLSALSPQADGSLAPMAEPGSAWKQCRNVDPAWCNWLVPAASQDEYCPACQLNRTIPDLHVPENVEKWRAIEAAKRRLIYALRRFDLPLASRHEDAAHGLAFDFLAEADPSHPVMTGHDDGLVTVNIAEADSAEREKRRVELGEPYRTLLGHLRHEVGHYYWDVLVRDGGKVEAARAVFGDESEDYAEALQRHYQQGAPLDWQDRFVSAYATMHPWEDFAETWTHYLHIVDTLDTAASFNLAVSPAVAADVSTETQVAFDPYVEPDFDRITAAWVPLSIAVNSLNRSMGQPDLYPFALSPAAVEKLRFIHDLIHGL